MKQTKLTTSLVALGLFGAGAAFGQTLPQAGQVGKDSLPNVQIPRDVNPIVAPALPSAAAASSSAASVSVSAFTFTGNTNISSEELQTVVASSLNQQLDFNGLDRVADSVSRYYRTKGYTVARAYLPPQQSAGGVIQISVIEGRYGAVNVKNGTSVSDERLRLTVANNLCDLSDGKDCIGKNIQDAGLERAILLLKDLPGVTATASLKPGQAVGTSDLDIETKVTKDAAYSLGYDNYGTPSTGVNRINASADFNNLGASGGDQLSLGIATTTTTKTKTGSASYSLPVGYEGQRVGVAFARSQYVLGAGFSATGTHGTSNALSAFTSYPIIRSVNQSLYARLSGEIRGGNSSIDVLNGTSAQSSFTTNANVLRLGVYGDHVDSWGDGGYTVYGLTLSEGFLGTNDQNDAAGAKTAGRFGKFSYNVARQQTLSGPFTLYASLNGQQARKNLDGSEQTGLGGPASTRGYGGEAGGSTGANGTLELRYTTPVQLGSDLANLTYGTFFDRGWVQYYQTPVISTAANTRSLSSYGLTLTLQSQTKVPTPTSTSYFLRAMYGTHSQAAAQQSAVDPTSKGKFWLQGGYSF
jgi:hemolysin activation/secretion protein